MNTEYPGSAEVDIAKDEIARYLICAVQKLRVGPDERIVIRLGDPEEGYVPGPDVERKVAQLMSELIDAKTPGFENAAPCLIVPYYIDPKNVPEYEDAVVRIAKPREQTQ